MKDKFYTLVTNIGKSKIANAAATQDKLELKTIQVGDSNGNYYEPTEDQTKLKNKVWEGQISSITVDDVNPNWIKIDSLIPSKVGGFTIREVGVFDIEGDLILIAKYPETYKPQLEDGSVKDLTIRLIMEISNVDSVTMKIDPSIILATKKEVDDVEKKLNDKIDNMDLGEIEEKTYNELKKLKTSRKLVVGSYYILTDYKSKYLQPTSKEIKEGDVEKLILFATTEQDFSSQVYSMDHHKDIIYYDFDNNKCEDKSTPRNGFITHRHDTINNNSCPYDFRNMLWARWCPDEKQYYKNDKLVDYEVWTSGDAKLDVIYKADNKLLIAKKIATPENKTDNNVFNIIYNDITIGCLINDKTKTFNKSIYIKRGELQERLTFGTNCTNNTFGGNCVNNVLGDDCKNNTFGHSCHSNTFGTKCSWNILGNNCTSNFFEENSSSNIFNNSCAQNIIGRSSDYNYFGNDCEDNIFGYACNANTFGNRCSANRFSNHCAYNTFENDCYNNSFDTSCDDNYFQNNCDHNIFKDSCCNNAFGNDCDGNTFGSGCINNTFGAYCFSNEFGVTCSKNYFQNYCYRNTFQDNCRVNTFGADCNANKFKDDCKYNTFGNTCSENILGDNCYGNTFQNGCKGNSFYGSCRWNSFGHSCNLNHFGSYCDYNTFNNECRINTFSDNLKYVVIESLQVKHLENISDIHNKDFTITITKGKDSNYYYHFYNGSREEYHQIP